MNDIVSQNFLLEFTLFVKTLILLGEKSHEL